MDKSVGALTAIVGLVKEGKGSKYVKKHRDAVARFFTHLTLFSKPLRTQVPVMQLRLLDSLITELTKHPLEIMEFFGCFRHFGHPTVDELAGMESLRENSTLPIEVNPKQLAKVSGAFNRMFILEFIAKKKRWPKCSLRAREFEQ